MKPNQTFRARELPLDKFHAMSHAERLDLYDKIENAEGIEAFINTEVLRALCAWNVPNGEYDECTHADLVAIIQSWREEG